MKHFETIRGWTSMCWQVWNICTEDILSTEI